MPVALSADVTVIASTSPYASHDHEENIWADIEATNENEISKAVGTPLISPRSSVSHIAGLVPSTVAFSVKSAYTAWAATITTTTATGVSACRSRIPM